MKKILWLTLCLLFGFLVTIAQTTCTVTGTSPLNWPTDGSGIVCSEGGNAVGKSVLIIPAGFVVNFNDIGDTWSGTSIEIWGTLNMTASVTINSSIVVENGGLLNLQGPLALGTSSGCGYTLTIEIGGTVDVDNSGDDRLTICGRRIMKGSTGGGSCNDCGGGSNMGKCALEPPSYKPYCEPPGGFVGPTGYGENGYDDSLPIGLLYFRASELNEKVKLSWATTMEENFSKFVIQRSGDGLIFEEIGEVPGKGFDIYEIESKYSFEDEAPRLGFNYYRLKAVDLDESFEYFGVKAVKLNGSKKLAIYPNPSAGEVISFRTNFSPSESDRVVLLNQLGVEIFSAHASTAQNSIAIQNKLRPGIYMLRYISKGFTQAARVVIKN